MLWEPGALAVIENLNLPFIIHVDSEGPIVESILKLFSAYIGTGYTVWVLIVVKYIVGKSLGQSNNPRSNHLLVV